MSDEKVHGHATVGVGIQAPEDPMRIAGRINRIRDALGRAEGERKDSLQAELDRLLARRAELIAALSE